VIDEQLGVKRFRIRIARGQVSAMDIVGAMNLCAQTSVE